MVKSRLTNLKKRKKTTKIEIETNIFRTADVSDRSLPNINYTQIIRLTLYSRPLVATQLTHRRTDYAYITEQHKKNQQEFAVSPTENASQIELPFSRTARATVQMRHYSSERSSLAELYRGVAGWGCIIGPDRCDWLSSLSMELAVSQ